MKKVDLEFNELEESDLEALNDKLDSIIDGVAIITALLQDEEPEEPPVKPDPKYALDVFFYAFIGGEYKPRVWNDVEWRESGSFSVPNTFDKFNGDYPTPQWWYLMNNTLWFPEEAVTEGYIDNFFTNEAPTDPPVDPPPVDPPVDPPIGTGRFAYVGINYVADSAGHIDKSPDGWLPVSGAEHWGGIGCNLVRFMTRQYNFHNLGEPLRQNYVDYVKDAVAKIYSTGAGVIIEPHDFGRLYYNGNTYQIGQGIYTIEAYADFWRKIATAFKDVPGVWAYEFDNEPYSLSIGRDGWKQACQASISAIREVDTTTRIVIPGYHWSNASQWKVASKDLYLLEDPSDLLVFDAHGYADNDETGTYNSGYGPEDILITRYKPFVEWLEEHGKLGIFGECGVPDTSMGRVRLQNVLNYLTNHTENVIGFLLWAAGPIWSSNYPLNINPTSSGDRGTVDMLLSYKE